MEQRKSLGNQGARRCGGLGTTCDCCPDRDQAVQGAVMLVRCCICPFSTSILLCPGGLLA